MERYFLFCSYLSTCLLRWPNLCPCLPHWLTLITPVIFIAAFCVVSTQTYLDAVRQCSAPSVSRAHSVRLSSIRGKSMFLNMQNRPSFNRRGVAKSHALSPSLVDLGACPRSPMRVPLRAPAPEGFSLFPSCVVLLYLIHI